MNFIVSILKDFHQCCNLPVKAISCELDTIYEIGYNEYLNKIYPKNIIRHAINNSNDKLLTLNIDMENNIYYKIVSISKFNKSRGYFVIGPISTSVLNRNENIPYRSIECCDYMCKLILDISEDKFNKSINNNLFNPYIRKTIEYVHQNYSEDIKIESLCKYLDINKCYFCSIFKKSTGHTFSYFLNSFRVEKSKKLLLNTDLSLLDIAISVGFNNQNYYSMVFKKYTNESPSQYRNSQTAV